MKKLIIPLLGVSFLSACGGSSNDSATPTKPTPETSTDILNDTKWQACLSINNEPGLLEVFEFKDGRYKIFAYSYDDPDCKQISANQFDDPLEGEGEYTLGERVTTSAGIEAYNYHNISDYDKQQGSKGCFDIVEAVQGTLYWGDKSTGGRDGDCETEDMRPVELDYTTPYHQVYD